MRRHSVCLAGHLAADESGWKKKEVGGKKKKSETCFNLQLLPADLSWYLPGQSLGRVWSQHQVSSRQARVGGG